MNFKDMEQVENTGFLVLSLIACIIITISLIMLTTPRAISIINFIRSAF